MMKNNGSRVLRGMRSASVITLTLIIAGCAGSAATVDTGAGADAAGSLAGTWEGTFDATDFSGEMTLKLTWEDGSYTGSLTATATAMDQEFTEPISNFKVEDATVTFYTYLAEVDIYFTGTVEEGKMSGTFAVFVEENQQDEATFSFVKK